MIARLNESKTLKKHISCKQKRKFDGPKCTSDQKWSNDKCLPESKKSERMSYV